MALMWDNTWLRVKEKCEQKKKEGVTHMAQVLWLTRMLQILIKL